MAVSRTARIARAKDIHHSSRSKHQPSISEREGLSRGRACEAAAHFSAAWRYHEPPASRAPKISTIPAVRSTSRRSQIAKDCLEVAPVRPLRISQPHGGITNRPHRARQRYPPFQPFEAPAVDL